MPPALVDLAAPGALGELLQRLETLEPEVLAFVAEPRRSERLAQRVADLASATRRGPLHGLSLGVKDIFHVDGLPTLAGFVTPPEPFVGEQSEAVRRLSDAGAVVVGKTVTTEIAYFAPGPTRNPRAPGHTPGGSSSGSAAAVAAGLVDVALGTQTIGSICRPAAFCGIVGWKPSHERVSRRGVVPLSPSLDHIGVLARTVSAAQRVAPVLADGWRQAVSATDEPRLGIPSGSYLEAAEPAGRRHFEGVCERLRGHGCTLVEVAVLRDFARLADRHRRLVAAEAAEVHHRLIEHHADRLHAKTRQLLDLGLTVTRAEAEEARRGRRLLRDELEQAMEHHGIDLWVAPSAPGPPPRGLESTGDPIMNLPWTYAGLPALTLPAGADDKGRPMGVQLIGCFGRDEELLAAGRRLEALLAEEGN